MSKWRATVYGLNMRLPIKYRADTDKRANFLSNCLSPESFKYLNAGFVNQHLSAFTDQLAFAGLEKSGNALTRTTSYNPEPLVETASQVIEAFFGRKYLPNLR